MADDESAAFFVWVKQICVIVMQICIEQIIDAVYGD